MRYILALLIFAGSYHIYVNYDFLELRERTMLEKLELGLGSKASAKDLKDHSKFLAQNACTGPGYLKSIGSSTESCLDRYKSYESMCDERVFPDDALTVRNAEAARDLISRYQSCTLRLST